MSDLICDITKAPLLAMNRGAFYDLVKRMYSLMFILLI